MLDAMPALAPDTQDAELAPNLTRMMLARARYVEHSTFLRHIPFAFWLVETLRPNVLVELGIGDGVSYLAMCQAMDRLRIGGHCFGIDLRPDGESPPPALLDHEALEYRELSEILRGASAASRFDDGSIDLLHVNLPLDQPVADLLFTAWRRKLSDRAVIVLQGMADWRIEGQAGNWLDALLANGPVLATDGPDALTAVMAGRDFNAAFARLAALKPGTAAHSEMQLLFGRLGEAHRLEWQVRSLTAALAAARDAAASAEHRAGQLPALQAELEGRRAEDRARSTEIQSLRQTIASQEGEATRLRTQLESRFREIFILTERLEATRGEKTGLQTQLDAASVEASGLRSLIEAGGIELNHLRQIQIGHLQAIEHAESERQKAEQRYREIARSPWWKATKPFRQLARAFRRR